MTRQVKDVALGVIFLLGIALLARLAVGQFNHEYERTLPATVEAPRAGLLLEKGSQVKLRGVEVGRVSKVEPAPGGARIHLALQPGKQRLIPADVRASIIPPTVFGSKYVELAGSTETDGPAIASGAVIDADHVTVETSTTFAHLAELLEAAPPAKVNAALTSLEAALSGRGEELGEFLTDLDAYLAQINPELQVFTRDLRSAARVAKTYADAAPDLVGVAENLTTTSNLIEDNPATLDAFLLSLRTVSTRSQRFLEANEDQLVTTLDVLAPTTQLLARYSPEFPCLFQGLVRALPLAEASIGGTNPGLTAESSFIPAIEPYRYPRDLPKVGADDPPGCYGLPDITGAVPPRHKVFDTGRDPYLNANPRPGVDLDNLAELLFGSLLGGTP
ncbi:MCE family protein [Aeromicrobium sp. NPDC092404]|uniref:MCE family protein n=1 Tax=Aeromicrobium sp. NPDC092404 TaxID=3154976 RepID=UPI0034361535